MAELFPVFLKLQNRRCLVVGAGQIAKQKIQGLLTSGAELRVVAPHADEHVRKLAEEGRVTWRERPFIPTDLDGVFLAVLATGDPALNDGIFRLCESRGVLCNAADEPERCDFYYPAVVRRGDLQIAISTNGQSPALAQRIRVELEDLFGPEYGSWLQWLGSVRKLFFSRHMDPACRRQALHRIASREVYERFVGSRNRNHKGSL